MDADGFRADVERTPGTLRALAATDQVGAWSSVDPGPVRRVLLLGMGSSAYAAGVAALRLRTAGVAAVAEVASVEASWPPGEHTLVVAVSATGGSAETLRLAQVYAGRAHLVALTDAPDSPLAALADHVVLLGAGPEEGGVSCRSYVHSLARLLALAERLTGRGPDLGDLVTRAADATADLLERRDAWLPSALDRLGGPHGVHVLAPAERLASAQQSALMVREGPRRPAVASETGDWAHVDVYLARTLDYRALLLAGSRWDAQAMEWLVRRGSTVVPVGADVPEAGTAVRYRHDDDPDVRLLAETTVADLVAASWWAATD